MGTRLVGVRRCLCSSVAVSIALVVSGCRDDGVSDASEPSPAVERLCGDASVSAQTREAVEVITGSNRKDVRELGPTVADVAKEVDARRQSTTRAFGEGCYIYAVGSADAERLKVSWYLTPKPATEPSPDFTMLRMGERAGAASDEGYVVFACADDSGSPDASPDYVGVRVDSRFGSRESEPDPKALRNAHATVAHSFALAMAKGLGCVDHAGLPAEPVLIP